MSILTNISIAAIYFIVIKKTISLELNFNNINI